MIFSQVTGGIEGSRSLTALDWAVIAAYAAGMLGVGYYYSRKTQSTEDYLLGGRNMRPWAVGLSLFATLLSTVSYLSWPGEMIQNGPMILCVLAAYPLIVLVVGWVLIPSIMKLQVTSAYEILEQRLGLSVRMLGAFLFLSLRLIWMALIVYATSDTVLVPLLGVSDSTTPWICALLTTITVIYASMGGLRAVVFTDVVQTAILFGGAFLALVLITADLGGVSQWWPHEWAPHWPPFRWFDPSARVSFFSASITAFTWYVCTAGSDQMAIQRYLATSNAKTARRAFIITMIADSVVMLLLVMLGFALLAYFQTHPEHIPTGQTLTSDADQLFPQYILLGLPAGITGLVIAGLLAAAMSSLSSGINSSCSVITVDFIERFQKHSQLAKNAHIRLAKYVSATVGVVVLALTFFIAQIHGNLLELAYKTANLLVAPLFLLFFMAMFIPWATSVGTIIGAFCGLAIAIEIAYFNHLELSFLWIMPLSFIFGSLIASLASFIPIRQKC